MEGFIQLHRSLLEWEWYDDTPTFKLFIHCLLKANYVEKKWRGIDIKRGQFITSLSNISHETGLTTKQVRNSIEKLVETGELGKQTTNRNTVITVLSYDKYQTEGKPNGKQRASKGQTEGKQRATTNKDNKENKDKKEINKYNIPPFEVFLSHAQSKIENICEQSVKLKYDSWVENEWRDGNDKQIKNWKSKLTNTVQFLKVKEVKKGYDPTKNIAL